ncbi:MAG: FAD:protein FMN transferase [Bacteroidetes bacterium]|nr:MAG: FAD:protein FMN transferase [Bacteroidota bacterium]
MKNLFFWVVILFLAGCAENSSTGSDSNASVGEYQRLWGNTMGTTYNVTYKDSQNRNFQESIDSLLIAVNAEVSTYEKQSTITRVNQAEDSIMVSGVENQHFFRNFQKAKEVYERSSGNFDPTVMPLVNYWGFGTSMKRAVTEIDSIKVDSLKKLVGFEKVQMQVQGNDLLIIKSNASVGIDFSACAKGGGVDAIGAFLKSKGVNDYLVDIGGELLANGVSPRGVSWKIGISVPKEDAAVDEVHTVVKLSNTAIATSGNHRNYYNTKGYKYGHTLNPSTGFPEKNDLLSATVFAPDCMTADAFATAFMVMGLEKAFNLASEVPDIEAFFIYGKPDGSMGVKYTDGASDFIE